MQKLLFIFLLFLSSIGLAQELKAIDSAQQWLKIIDAVNYAESWEASDAFFKTLISKEQWSEALQSIRAPLGDVISRSELNSNFFTSFSGMPEGEYVVLQFKTQFEKKEGLTEIITLSKSSGNWQAVGYFIK